MTNDSFIENEMSNRTFIENEFLVIIEAFFGYFTPLIGLIGVISNSLSIMVFATCKRKDVSSTVQYLGVLAVVDLFNSGYWTGWCFVNWGLKHLTGGQYFLDFWSVSLWTCRVARYAELTFTQMSSWLLAMFSGERCLAVCTPLKISSIVSSKRRYKGMFLIFLISLLTNLNCLISFVGFYNEDFEECKVVDGQEICFVIKGTFDCYLDFTKYTSVEMLTLGILELSLKMAIPGLLILVFNLAICRALYLQSRDKKELTSGRDDGEMSTVNRKCMINLVGISILFLAANAPTIILWNVFNVIYFIVETQENPIRVNWSFWSVVAMAFGSLMIINYSFNFFIYCYSLDFYRQKLLKWFCCKKFEKQQTFVTETTDSRVT